MAGEKHCHECGGQGTIEITECPREFVGHEIAEAVNIASMCGNGILPIDGGLMKQSAWFLSLWQCLKAEESTIDAEQLERSRSV